MLVRKRVNSYRLLLGVVDTLISSGFSVVVVVFLLDFSLEVLVGLLGGDIKLSSFLQSVNHC